MKKTFLAIAISGLLFALAWNSYFPSISLFFAFVPVLYLFEDDKIPDIRMFYYSFSILFIYHLGSVWWLYKSSLLGAFLIISLNSFYLALALLFIHKLRKLYEMKSLWFTFPAIWLSFEYIHYWWELSWPFMNLGNWLGQVIKFIQWYEYTGVLGGSLWIILSNLLIYTILKRLQLKKIRSVVIFGIILLILVIFPGLFSLFLFNHTYDSNQIKTFKIIQPNIDPYTAKYNPKLYNDQIIMQIDLANFSVKSEADCYLFPESSFPVFLNEDSASLDPFINLLKSKIREKDIEVVGGLYSFIVKDGDTIYYNTAFQIAQDEIKLRHKSKLVIGVEKMPFDHIFTFLKRFNIDFGGINNSLAADNEPITFKSNNGFSLGTLICYESVYGQFVSGFVNGGAGFLAVITNDAWWGKTPAYEQHLMHSKLRAIENRRYVIRAGNTGISCIINPHGEITTQVNQLEINTLSANVPQISGMSFYTRKGDLIGKIALICSSLILILSFYTIKFRKPSL